MCRMDMGFYSTILFVAPNTVLTQHPGRFNLREILTVALMSDRMLLIHILHEPA